MRIPREWQLLEVEHQDAILRHSETPPVKVSHIARDLGVSVSLASFPTSISGQLRRTEKTASGFEIRVNRHEARVRQRFTISHELAHYFLHRSLIEDEIVDNILYRSKLSDDLEVQANRLGAEIIMPARLIRRAYAELNSTLDEMVVERLAGMFEVSFDAMKYRTGWRNG